MTVSPTASCTACHGTVYSTAWSTARKDAGESEKTGET